MGAHTSQALALPVRLSQNNSPPFAPKLPLTPAIQRRCRGSGIQVVCTGECVVSLVCRSFAANCRCCCCWPGPERYIQSTPDDCVPYCVLVDKLGWGTEMQHEQPTSPGRRLSNQRQGHQASGNEGGRKCDRPVCGRGHGGIPPLRASSREKRWVVQFRSVISHSEHCEKPTRSKSPGGAMTARWRALRGAWSGWWSERAELGSQDPGKRVRHSTSTQRPTGRRLPLWDELH